MNIDLEKNYFIKPTFKLVLLFKKTRIWKFRILENSILRIE